MNWKALFEMLSEVDWSRVEDAFRPVVPHLIAAWNAVDRQALAQAMTPVIKNMKFDRESMSDDAYHAACALQEVLIEALENLEDMEARREAIRQGRIWMDKMKEKGEEVTPKREVKVAKVVRTEEIAEDKGK